MTCIFFIFIMISSSLSLDEKCKNLLPIRKCKLLKKFYWKIDICTTLNVMKKYCKQFCGLCGKFAVSDTHLFI